MRKIIRHPLKQFAIAGGEDMGLELRGRTR